MRDSVAESPLNFHEHGASAAIFHGIVQERCNGEFFVSTGFEHQSGDTHQVRNVRDRATFLRLASMNSGSE
jgi:hypothetical protein